MSPKLAHQLTPNVKLLQKAVLIHDGQVLLLKRHDQAASRPNCWDLPGGNSEWPTHLAELTRGLHLQDLVREIKEETGIELETQSFASSDLVYFDTVYEPQREMYTILCGWRQVLSAPRPTVTISDEHTQYQWVSPTDLKQYDFGFATFIPQMIQQAIQ